MYSQNSFFFLMKKHFSIAVVYLAQLCVMMVLFTCKFFDNPPIKRGSLSLQPLSRC